MDDAMTERNKPSPHVEARSVFSQIVETQLLPLEFFHGEQNGEVVDIAKIDEVVATLRKVKDHYELELYLPKGKSAKYTLDPSTYDLCKEVNEWIHARPDATYGKRPQENFSNLGYGPNTAQRLTESWYRIVSNQHYQVDSDGSTRGGIIRQKPNIFLSVGDWKMGVLSYPIGDRKNILQLVVTADGNWFTVDPKNPQSKQAIKVSNEAIAEHITHGRTELVDNLQLRCGETIFQIQDENGRELTSYSGTDPKVDPVDPNFLYFINTGRIYKLDLRGVAKRQTKPLLEAQIQVEDPQELDIEPNGNFLVIRSAGDKLSIVEKETGDVTRSFDGVGGPVLVDDQGDIFFIDKDSKLRKIQTNFQAIPKGGSEVAKKKREEELKSLQERYATLELEKTQKVKGTQITEEDVANTLRETISKQVSERISTATDAEQLEDVLDRLQGLRADPQNEAYGQVIDEFVGQAKEKLSAIQTVQLDQNFSEFAKSLEGVQSVGDTIGLDEQFARLLEARQKIDVADVAKRREIEQRLNLLQGQMNTVIDQYQGELVDTAHQTLPQIEELIRETGSLQELSSFGTTSQSLQFEMMLANIRDPKVRKELRDQLTGLKDGQRTKLEETNRQVEEQQRLRWAELIEETRGDLESIGDQIRQLSDTREIDRFGGRHPLVTSFRAKILRLPPELREQEEKRLEILLSSRKTDIEHREELGAVGKAGELRFGNVTFPIYKEPPRLWQPKLLPIKGGMYADLVFVDSQGTVFHPDPEHPIAVNPDPNDERTKQLIEEYKQKAEEYFRGIKRRVPDFDEHWRITEFHMAKLEEIAETLNLQLDNHRGVLILQGEAGTGKNVLVDMLANLSNREVIPILCNENSVKEDLTYEFYYDPEKGTYKLPSKLVEGIQKPGTIILFDEINALKPGIAKMLNSLFDYRRRIFLPEGGREREIITDPTVLFAGTMNPQNYAGINRLSPEVKSRSRVVDIEYPQFEEVGGRTQYHSHEAEMLAAYMDNLEGLKQKEFRLCWDYVINRDTTNGADVILQGNPRIEVDIRRIYDVIRVANRLREMYGAYQTGDSNEPMDFPTSLREVIDIALEMNHRQGLKNIMKRVIVPKIDDRRQKRLVEQTIDAVMPNE